jgi:hypothetical protein
MWGGQSCLKTLFLIRAEDKLMNIEKIFKRLIIAQMLFFAFMLVYVTISDDSNGTDNVELTNSDLIHVLLVFLYYVNLYLLFKFNKIGRDLFVPLLILLFVFSFGVDESYDAIVLAYEALDWVITGMILALLYWTDIKVKFES